MWDYRGRETLSSPREPHVFKSRQEECLNLKKTEDVLRIESPEEDQVSQKHNAMGTPKAQRPIPAPRYSLLSKRSQSLSSPIHQRSISEPAYQQYNDGSSGSCSDPSRRKSDSPVTPKPRTVFLIHDNQPHNVSTSPPHTNLTSETVEPAIKKPSIKSRTLSSLLKPRKLLLMRRNSKNKEKYCSMDSVCDIGKKASLKPKRSPPLPPAQTYCRPPAPLPGDNGESTDDYEDGSTFSADLYNDADDRDIYATIGERDSCTSSSDHYEGMSDYEGSPKNLCSEGDDDFYQDVECSGVEEQVYEVLPNNDTCNTSTPSPSMGSSLERDDTLSKQKLSKPEKKAAKLRKRFNLTGNEIPVNAGIVKEDAKGGGSDLMVKKGEVVLILRMDKNPPGKWLAKSERSKIGYVDLNIIDVDPESIKSIMNISSLYQT